MYNPSKARIQALKNSTQVADKTLNNYLAATFAKNPALATTISTILQNGIICIYGKNLKKICKNNTFYHNQVFYKPCPKTLSLLTARDVYFIETEDANLLKKISSKTSAQIILVTENNGPHQNLFEYKINLLMFKSINQNLITNKYFLKNNQINYSNKKSKPAVFLDRDGVIIKHVDHISKPQNVRLENGVAQFIKKFRKKGYLIVIITNQSGIGRGKFTWQDYDNVTQKMLQLLAEEKTYIDHIFHSPFFEKSKLALGLVRKSLRKPRAGMIVTAANEFNLDLSRSILVGDRATDIIAAQLAELKKAYLIKTDNFEKENRILNEFLILSKCTFNTTIIPIKNLKQI